MVYQEHLPGERQTGDQSQTPLYRSQQGFYSDIANLCGHLQLPPHIVTAECLHWRSDVFNLDLLFPRVVAILLNNEVINGQTVSALRGVAPAKL